MINYCGGDQTSVTQMNIYKLTNGLPLFIRIRWIVDPRGIGILGMLQTYETFESWILRHVKITTPPTPLGIKIIGTEIREQRRSKPNTVTDGIKQNTTRYTP